MASKYYLLERWLRTIEYVIYVVKSSVGILLGRKLFAPMKRNAYKYSSKIETAMNLEKTDTHTNDRNEFNL